MKIITLVETSRPGLLAEITALLADRGIDVKDIDGQTVGPEAVITLTATPYRRCFDLLADAGYRVVADEHLLVRLPDRPGALAKLSRTLAEAGIDIRGIHFVSKGPRASIVALQTGDPEAARGLLGDILVHGGARGRRNRINAAGAAS